MSGKVSEALIILGGTGNLDRKGLPLLADAGYHLVVFSRSEVSGAPFDHAHVWVQVGTLDEAEFIDSLGTTALRHADKLRGALFLNGGFTSDDAEVVDAHVRRPRFIGTKEEQDAPADLAQEMLDAVQ